MHAVDELLGLPPFDVPGEVKRTALARAVAELDHLHRARGGAYGRIRARLRWPAGERIEDQPFIPVDLFKVMELRSVPAADVRVVLRSSGTTGAPSRVPLDAETARLQARVLSRIVAAVAGARRLPMLVVDAPPSRDAPAGHTARQAAALGFMKAGRDYRFLLRPDGSADAAVARDFEDRHRDEPVLVFGMTFAVWEHLCADGPLRRGLPHGILLHGGGWKRLQERAVSAAEFRAGVREATGIAEVRNYYGLVEQVGSVFMEDEDGLLCAPTYADVVVRDAATLEPLPPGRPGIVQVLSAVPRSYPGHSLLTADLGVIEEPGRSSRWNGTRFRVLGRVPGADPRGCSDAAGGPA